MVRGPWFGVDAVAHFAPENLLGARLDRREQTVADLLRRVLALDGPFGLGVSGAAHHAWRLAPLAKVGREALVRRRLAEGRLGLGLGWG